MLGKTKEISIPKMLENLEPVAMAAFQPGTRTRAQSMVGLELEEKHKKNEVAKRHPARVEMVQSKAERWTEHM